MKTQLDLLVPIARKIRCLGLEGQRSSEITGPWIFHLWQLESFESIKHSFGYWVWGLFEDYRIALGSEIGDWCHSLTDWQVATITWFPSRRLRTWRLSRDRVLAGYEQNPLWYHDKGQENRWETGCFYIIVMCLQREKCPLFIQSYNDLNMEKISIAGCQCLRNGR